jgi:hypothetical protein
MAQRGRYELKFILDEERAKAVTRYVRTYLRATPYNRWGVVPGQPIVSLYFDSPDFLLFRQTCCGLKNRIKLRIRFYDDNPAHPAFLEIKRRMNDVIAKARAMINREEVRRMMEGGWPQLSYWPNPSALMGPPRLGAYNDFWSLSNVIRARGMAYVSYLREAYDSPADETLRVTLDRMVSATAYDGAGELRMPLRGVPPPNREPHWIPPGAVVLEMKFDERAPRWMMDMARIFNLQRRPVSKYCACIDALGLARGRRVLPDQGMPLLLHGTD